jgi:phosphoglycerate dehydrogenase-like enzyme
VIHVLIHVQHEVQVWTLPESYVAELRRDFPAVRFTHARSGAELAAALPEADVLFGWGLDAANFARATRLRWVQLPAAGVQRMLFPGMIASPVVLTNARGVHAVPIAEHVIGVILGFARKLHLARDEQSRGRWSQEALWSDAPPFRELQDSTLGLLGLGTIGAAVAARARPLGMRVLGIRRRDLPAPDVDELLPAARLHDLLARSHFVVCSLPYTRETRGFLGAAEFAAMREDAVLVSVGRGKVLDEAALVAALQRGRPAGAALDVFAHEPLDPASPLFKLPQVLLTPHIAGATPRYWPRMLDLFRMNLERFLRGEPLANVVDKHAGY